MLRPATIVQVQSQAVIAHEVMIALAAVVDVCAVHRSELFPYARVIFYAVVCSVLALERPALKKRCVNQAARFLMHCLHARQRMNTRQNESGVHIMLSACSERHCMHSKLLPRQPLACSSQLLA